jgi:cellobiose phosphorylase
MHNDAAVYLFPFVLEYSLLATGDLAIMLEKLGHDEKPDVMANIKQIFHK